MTIGELKEACRLERRLERFAQHIETDAGFMQHFCGCALPRESRNFRNSRWIGPFQSNGRQPSSSHFNLSHSEAARV